MNFYDASFVEKHCADILAFYTDRVIDPHGGYFQNYLDNGDLFNPGFKQLVSSTRIIVNYATAFLLFKNTRYKEIAKHGLDYLETFHWREDMQGYAWTLQDNKPLDLTQQAYGYAFVLLAYAACAKIELLEDTRQIQKVYDLLETRFWQPEYGLYADEISSEGKLGDYRGQNANMHLCEAMLACYEATGEEQYLTRANTLAWNISVRQANLTDGLIWEHYTTAFEPDWEYNKDDPKNLYRPWGFQPGHQTEWAKLLLILYKHKPQTWQLERAQQLFDRAYEKAWDHEFGGLIYGFSPAGDWCDDEKYFWVQAESIAAAALLYEITEKPQYLAQYQSLWEYSWKHMVDHKYGAWFRLLDRQNRKVTQEKSAAGAKCDYHTFCACVEVLRSLKHPHLA